MILKRFLFPIFILLIFSCKKNSDYDTDFNTFNYDDAIKKAAEYLENQKYDRGIIPDYNITQTFIDFINNTDTQMNFTIELIRNKYLH